jgi:DNA-binding NarL/FixJ family response regulator
MVQFAVQSASERRGRSFLALPFSHAPGPAASGRLNIMVMAAAPLFRAALCWTLLRLRPDGVITEVSRLSDALDGLRHDPSALVLLDDDLFEGGALEVLKILKAQCSAPVAILSSDASRSAARRALDYGACGYIAKSESLEDMTATLCKLAEQAARSRTGRLQVVASLCEEGDNVLTPAQTRVLSLIEKGQLNKQIAHEMGIAESTVKAHVSAIFRKLNVQNRVQAILAASRLSGALAPARMA